MSQIQVEGNIIQIVIKCQEFFVFKSRKREVFFFIPQQSFSWPVRMSSVTQLFLVFFYFHRLSYSFLCCHFAHLRTGVSACPVIKFTCFESVLVRRQGILFVHIRLFAGSKLFWIFPGTPLQPRDESIKSGEITEIITKVLKKM